MSFKIQKINNEKVKPVKVPKVNLDEVKGGDLFRLDARIFVCASSRSGKTTVINTIIKKCTDKNTRFFIFAPTVDTDPLYIYIQQFLKKRGNEVEVFNSLKVENQDMLKDILDQLNEEKRKTQNAEDNKEQAVKNILFEDEPEPEKPKERKPKKKAPELFFILDDLGQQLRNSTVSDMLKLIRHYRSKFIISTQHPNDVRPEGRNQCDYLLVFKGHNEEKLHELYLNFNISMPFEEFQKLYHDATKDNYCFLYFDKINNEFRKCFDQKYLL